MDNDDYGFCYHLEKDAAKVLDKANLAAFVTQVRARFDAAANAARQTDSTHNDHPDHEHHDRPLDSPSLFAADTLPTAPNEMIAYPRAI
jgi:hypothetical protein